MKNKAYDDFQKMKKNIYDDIYKQEMAYLKDLTDYLKRNMNFLSIYDAPWIEQGITEIQEKHKFKI